MTNTSTPEERAAFEDAMAANGYRCRERNTNGGYLYRHDQDRWIGYRAARATLPAPTAVNQCGGCNGRGMINGILSDGYIGEECPFCKGSGIDTRSPCHPTQGAAAMTNTSAPESSKLLDPDMSASTIRLHMGEISEREVRTARAAIRWANSRATLPAAASQ